MKTLLIVTILLGLGGCASQNEPTPSQNKALNSVSKSTADTKEKGYLQEHLDSWLEKEWEPATAGFEKRKQKTTTKDNLPSEPSRAETSANSDDAVDVSQKSTQSEDESFTLQHYVDKAKYYMEHKKKSNAPSHVEKLKKMPVIGE